MAGTQPTTLTYEEAAVRLGVSRQTIADYVKRGKLRRGKRHSDGRWVVSATDVEKLAAERKTPGEGEVTWEQ